MVLDDPFAAFAHRPGSLLKLSAFLLVASATVGMSVAQPAHSPARMNSRLFQALDEYRGAAGPAVVQELGSAVAERQENMRRLVSEDPSSFLAASLPDGVRTLLPARLQRLMERPVTLQGELEVTIEDGYNDSRLYYNLLSSANRIALHFSEAPPELQTGDEVQIDGVQLGSDVAVNTAGLTVVAGGFKPELKTQFQAQAVTPLPNTFGAQKTLVMLVNFQDNTSQPFTPSAAQSMTFTTASNFWLENSFQQTWLTGDVAGWYTLPITSTACNTSSIQTYAQQAAQNAGYVLSNYAHLVYMFPQITACGWLGYSYIGGNPSNSWINGDLIQQVVSHELGHALGLYHAHALSCGSQVYASSGCTQYEYGDSYDTMASSNFNGYSMHYNAFQKERLGWLNYSTQPPINSVTTSGTYTVAPYETQDTGPKALKIFRSTSSSGSTYYYVEARQAIGFDAILSNSVPGYSEVLKGVLVHIATPGSGNTSNLLDMNPSAAWGQAMALDVGQSYTDAAAGITISTQAVSSAGATVAVTLASPACTPANPSVSISPSQSSAVAPGTTVSFTVSVTDRDSSTCSTAAFNLTSAVPSGWNAVFGASTLTLSPGGAGSTTLQVTSPATAASGSYTISATATNAAAASYNASASATYVLSPPATAPTLTVTTSQSSYMPGQIVGMTVTVLSGTTACAGASVTVNVMQPNGKTAATLTGKTGTNGVAALSYKLSKSAQAGAWQGKGNATVNGKSGSGGTTFSVQ